MSEYLAAEIIAGYTRMDRIEDLVIMLAGAVTFAIVISLVSMLRGR